MIPNSVLRGPSKYWTATVQLDGQLFDLAGEVPRRSLGFGQPRGTCSLATRYFPNVPTGSAATVLLTLNESYTVTFFTGFVGARPISDSPLKYDLSLVDSLAWLSVPLGSKLVWSHRSYPDAVRDLLHRAGFLDAAITSIYDPGSTFTVGPVDPIEIKADVTIQTALDELLTFGGCGLFVLPDGTLTVVDAPGWAGATDTNTPVYAFGATTEEFGFYNASRTIVGTESVVAQFTAKGNRLSTEKIADATFTLSGVSGTSVTETYNHLQTDACAIAIAEREIVRRNRDATQVDVTAPLNPNLRPGDTVLFRHPELGYAANTAAIIIGIGSNGDEMTMTLSVGAAPAAGTITLIPSPSPNFTLRFEVQPVKLAGVLAVNTLVECTDTSTDPSGLTITNRDWKAACSGSTKPEPETVQWSYDAAKTATENPVPNPVFVFPTLTGATITLTVESSSGEGNIKTQAVVEPTASAVFTRTITVAAGVMGWRVLAGSQGWRSFIGDADCTAVPPINDQGPLVAGFANGEIRQTQDMLASPPSLTATLPASVRCLWMNEGNPLIMLAGAGTGLHRSSDGGTSWTLVHTFPDSIEYCENSPTNPLEIRVCAGAMLYRSYDGATFGTPLSGVDGTLCRKVASAPWGHLMVFSGGDILRSAWSFEESDLSIDWSQVAAENLPLDLAAATPLQYEEGYLVADGGAAEMIRDGLFSQLGYLANQGITNIYKLTRAGTTFVATYCATADEGGPLKIIMAGGKAFPIDTSDALRIGYGQPTDPARPPQIIVLPSGASGTADRLGWYVPETGWQYRELPLAGAAWIGLDICPPNANAWLIHTATAAFFTKNSGQTWTQLQMPAWGNFGGAIRALRFSGIGTQWVMAAHYLDAWGTGRFGQGYLAQGDGATVKLRRLNGSIYPLSSPTPSGTFIHPTTLLRGYPGEVWGYATTSLKAYPEFGVGEPERMVWIDATTLALTDVGATAYAPASIEDPTTGRAGYAVWNTNVARTPNYRTTVPDPATAVAVGTSVAACQAGLFVGGRTGIAAIATFTTTPVVTVVAASGILVGPIVAGSQRRGAGALGGRTIFAYNGTQWASLPLPEELTTVCPQIGVLEP